MAKTKEQKLKGNATEQVAPDNGKPFETSGDVSGENEDYPKDINPFLTKRTKSMKEAEKREKKRDKMEERARKKEEKLGSGGSAKQEKQQIVTKATEINVKHGTKINNNQDPLENGNASSTLPPIRAPQMESKPQERKSSQTLDNRSPSNENPKLLHDKRLMQLKTGMESSGRPSSSPDMNKQKITHHTPGQGRPQSLEVNPQSPGSNRGVSPLRDHRTPSPLVDRAPPLHQRNEDFKMYRSSSISKKGKGKEKKKMKKMLKKKKASKGKESNLLKDEDIAEQVLLRHPKPKTIEDLQNEVTETQEYLRSSILNLAEQRNVQLESMLENVKGLEEAAHGFATVAHETRLKKQAGATCCGLWKNWKICWYICACQTGVKKKKKWKGDSKNNKGAPEAHELLSPRAAADQNDDADDYYRPAADEDTTSGSVTKTRAQVNPRPLSTTYSVGVESVNSTQSPSIRSKLSKIPKSIMASLPSLVDNTPPMESSLRDMAQIDPRRRKSSSVSALNDILKFRGAKKREARGRRHREKERQQKDKEIEEFASQYQDEKTRQKVEDLLKMDLDTPDSS